MNWDKAITILLKLHNLNRQRETIGKVKDLGDRLQNTPVSKLTKEDFKFANVRSTTDAMKAIDEVNIDLDKILGADFEIPEPEGTEAALMKLIDLADKYPAGSPERKAGWASYIKLLQAYDKVLTEESVPLRTAKAEIPSKIVAAQGLATMARALEEALMKCAEIPIPGSGTSMNAAFFEMANDAGFIAGGGGKAADKLIEINEKNFENLEALKERVEDNRSWMAWAAKGAGRKPEEIKKNSKTKTPR